MFVYIYVCLYTLERFALIVSVWEALKRSSPGEEGRWPLSCKQSAAAIRRWRTGLRLVDRSVVQTKLSTVEI